MDYPTFRPLTKILYKQPTSHKNNFANIIITMKMDQKQQKTSKTNTQSSLFLQSQNISQPTLNSVNFHDQTRSS